MCTLLNIAHSSNRFWLFVDFTEAAMNHFIVTFPTASVFSVLETCERRYISSYLITYPSNKHLLNVYNKPATFLVAEGPEVN